MNEEQIRGKNPSYLGIIDMTQSAIKDIWHLVRYFRNIDGIAARLMCFVFRYGIPIVFASNAYAASAPKALLGRSVAINWMEEREQRPLPDGEWRNVQVVHITNVYVSTAGRVFRRDSAKNLNNRNSNNQYGGSRDADVGNGSERFGDNQLIITTAAKRGGGARQTVVQFDPDYRTCQATVINGSSSSDGSYVRKSLETGREIEIKHTKTSLVNCDIKEGNVFQ